METGRAVGCGGVAAGVVHAVVARGVEDVLERADGADDLRVDPELAQRVERRVHDEEGRVEQQGQDDHLEGPAGELLEAQIVLEIDPRG